jgi:hypothetical protein
MKLRLSYAMLVAALFASAAQAQAATCAPAKLVHIRFVDVTPGVDPTSFAAKPKEFYRIGSGKVRIEEAVDATTGIRGLIVTDEPNIWFANLYDHSGKHIVDPGPTFFAKAPVFGVILPGKLIDLEFGCESDFIAANGPEPVRSELVGGNTYNVYRVEDGSDAVEILRKTGTTTPAFARYYHQGTLQIALRYDLYAADLPNDPGLFSPPSDVRFAEPSHQ